MDWGFFFLLFGLELVKVNNIYQKNTQYSKQTSEFLVMRQSSFVCLLGMGVKVVFDIPWEPV